MYENVLFLPNAEIDTTINPIPLTSRFESTGFWTMDNSEFSTDFEKEFTFVRPQYKEFRTQVGEQESIAGNYAGYASIINHTITQLIKEVKSSLGGNYPILPNGTPRLAEIKKLHIETMAQLVTTRFDLLMIEELLGAGAQLEKDELRNGTSQAASNPDLATDTGRAIATQTLNLTGQAVVSNGKNLLEELHTAARKSTELSRANEPLYVLLPHNAFLAYWNTFNVGGLDCSEIQNNQFRCANFNFISFPIDEYPSSSGNYNCLILPRSSVKFRILTDSETSSDYKRDAFGQAITDENDKPILQSFRSQFFVHCEEKSTSTSQEDSRGLLVTVSRKGGAVRYKPDLIQGWNIPTNLIPATI
jgi:hypothetical protein